MSLRLMSAVISPSVHIDRIEEAEKLLKQLLECVQECQKRYGGKTELATEFDSCVAGLCLTLESVFLHGLRSKPTNTDRTTLKQVSDIVTHSLSIGNDNPSYWPFVKKHLTKHEEERYAILKQIWTDTGRGRAWIRSALNERSLERYFHTVLSNSDLLKEHYESWAVLRDDDKNSMLPNMAAGLGSILFAISIDKPELNSGITYRPESLKVKTEPIIEAPIPGNVDKRERKKRKVARHIISFDDDDSVHSASIPSSASSSTSDSNSLGEGRTLKNKSSYINDKNKYSNMEENTANSVLAEDKEKPSQVVRKLSIENSGSREKFIPTVPDTLTPVTEMGVGELTPISVEVNKNFESPDTSDDILEVPTDISAVLTAVESKNKEELSKKEDAIRLLTKENQALKEQVKKYVSAIQMLRRDDEGLQKALEGLQIEEQPDYKGEAKIFEKKLVQVAEMHAELMDFNVMLQQNICQKDALLTRLKTELESLRGPMPSDELNSEETMGSVNVWIPSAFLTGSASNSHHVYQIFLRAGNDEWNIYRRYAQFYALHTDLKKLDPVVGTFDFPPKKSIGKKDSALVEDRRKRFQIYLRKILAHWPELAHCSSRFLLEQHLSFFKDQKESKKITSPPRRAGDTSNNYSGL